VVKRIAFNTLTNSSRPTQPGHPVVGRSSEYCRWFRPRLVGKKRQVLLTGP